MTAEETLNELLVGLFKDLMEIEARCLITEEFSDISINDMHIIEAIGVDEPKRSGTVAALMSITLGTLTKAIDGLTRKGYVSRIRSDEDKRVVKLSLTDKGKRTLKEAAPLIDRLFNASQTEIELAQKLGIDRAIIVPGDMDRQERVVDLMGEQLNSALDLLLPLGKSIITVLGGTTVAGVAHHLSPKLSRYRDLLFVPGRGAVGESVEIQSNTVAQMMASETGGKHKGLYLPENVSSEALTLLLQDTDIANAISNIYNSDMVIHGIGRADVMSKRRGLDVMTSSKLRNDGAVAECFGYFFDQQGRLVKRIPRIGLQLEDLDKIPHVFAIAAGASKASAIVAYMHHAPKQTWLITDEGASNLVLKGK